MLLANQGDICLLDNISLIYVLQAPFSEQPLPKMYILPFPTICKRPDVQILSTFVLSRYNIYIGVNPLQDSVLKKAC